jgi:mRNA interferase MazF
MGRLLDAVIAAPVTSTVRGVSTEVPLGPDDGVKVKSVTNLDSVQLVSRTRLVRRVGKVREVTIDAICRALSIAAGCT